MSVNARPAKRQRRSTRLSNDDDDDEPLSWTSLPLRRTDDSQVEASTSSAPVLSTGKSLKKATRNHGTRLSSAQPSPKSSPEKARKSKKLTLDDTKNKSLHTFFNKVTEEERWRKRSATPERSQQTAELEDDIIDDESMDEALSEAIRRSEQDLAKHQDAVAPPRSVPVPIPVALKPPPSVNQFKPMPSASQRFRKPVLASKTLPEFQGNEHEHDQNKPWAERYGPVSLDELAVHKKKVQDVQKWLDDALTDKPRQRILVMKGPAGSGKSTALNLLSNIQSCELVPWRNPDTSEAGALSSSLQFGEFITRGGEYGALSMSDEVWQNSPEVSARRVLLVEEFPASMTRTSNMLESFRSVLLRAASSIGSNLPGQNADVSKPPPIVLIISETLTSSSTTFTDSFTAQRLLGPELINHPGVFVIEFNPVAPTYLSKAIDTVIKKEARDSKRRRIPGPLVLQKLSEMGDVRNAVNSLQFLCTRGDDNGNWSGTVAANAKRGSKSNQPLSGMEKDSLKLISARETTLDMFHAAGKVCYNKREDPRVADNRAQPPPRPPDYLMHTYRPKVSQVDVEDLLNETGTDIQTFVSTVHQNYVLSCQHADFVDYFDGCAAVLSDSELLDPDSRAQMRTRARAQATRNTFQLGTSDSLRQDEISFQVATRGVIFNLPFPVSRATPPGGRKGDAFKMFYPAAMRLWKPIEETNGLLDLVVVQLSGQDSARSSSAGGVSTWGIRASAFESQPTLPGDDDDHTEGNADTIPRTGLSSDSLVLDTLPYMTQIKESRDEDTTVLKKITQLRGFNVSMEEEPDEQPAVEKVPGSVRLAQKVEAVHRSLQLQAERVQRLEKKSVVEEPAVERLFIEDDDIEDD